LPRLAPCSTLSRRGCQQATGGKSRPEYRKVGSFHQGCSRPAKFYQDPIATLSNDHVNKIRKPNIDENDGLGQNTTEIKLATEDTQNSIKSKIMMTARYRILLTIIHILGL